jgi:hypothetical protein
MQTIQYTLPFALPTPADPLADYDCDSGGFIGIDANPYCIRLAHCYLDGVILDTIEAKPHQLARVIHWVRARKRYFPDAELTGDRKDRWPPGLLPALVMEFGPVGWVPEHLLRKTVPEFRRTSHVLKFFRAAFLTACAQEGHDFFEPCAKTVMNRWRKAMLKEMCFGLDPIPAIDDIPF